MRITGGSHRGRVLFSPEGQDVRPTADKTRLAMFNMLQSRQLIVDAVVMDVFCGTGALGLEAVSRGAQSALLVDVSSRSLALAQKNIQALRLEKQVTTLAADAAKLPSRLGTVAPAQLVFLDPPYRQNLVDPTLVRLDQGGWLARGATLVIEVEGEYSPTWPVHFTMRDQKSYGQSAVYLVEYSPT